MKRSRVTWFLLVATAVGSVVAAGASPAGVPAAARPRLGEAGTLVVSVQGGDGVQLTLWDPAGNRACFGPDSSASRIPGCDIEPWAVDDVADTGDAGAHGVRFVASRSEVGVWRLEAVLARESAAASSLLLDAGVESREGILEDLTISPGQKATWVLRILATGDIRRTQAVLTSLPLTGGGRR